MVGNSRVRIIQFNTLDKEIMKTEIEKTIPYSEMSYATEPTRWTKFWRRSFIFQLIRFFVLNLKIMRIVVGGHS